MGALSFSVRTLPFAPVAGTRAVDCAPGLCKVWEAPLAAHRGEAICCRAEWGSTDPDLWQAILSSQERKYWGETRAVEKRRREWLLGRAVAKDAVRRLIARHVGAELEPADIEIVPDAYGCPHARGPWSSELRVHPAISIAHSEGTAVALAVLEQGMVAGIDLESVNRRRETFETVAFSAGERGLLDRIPEDLRQEWALRMWCAKEAVGKALGRGLSAGLLTFRIPEIETHTGSVPVEWQEATFVTATAREAGFVFATIICERRAVR